MHQCTRGSLHIRDDVAGSYATQRVAACLVVIFQSTPGCLGACNQGGAAAEDADNRTTWCRCTQTVDRTGLAYAANGSSIQPTGKKIIALSVSVCVCPCEGPFQFVIARVCTPTAATLKRHVVTRCDKPCLPPYLPAFTKSGWFTNQDINQEKGTSSQKKTQESLLHSFTRPNFCC